ncbi:folliculin [Venturia canescens]|uniref:folliculin n=1 Tax=Venturia canescens TaxID=32260 RepID=UPI001C9C8EE2|nr:folliculin [Venturia canescens]
MNAVIAMCTFCEMHGPRVIFTTQTYRTFDETCVKKMRFYGPKEIMRRGGSDNAGESSDDPLLHRTNENYDKNCDGCESLGNVKYLSNEHESRTSFLSARQALTEDMVNLLKHACIRSLSCEVHLGKEGVCYFGDEHRGHVLSHAFTLKDAQARGIRRSCSFIVFMRDKQFLLNMWPFLVDNLRQVIRELQEYAEIKYRADEAENPQRSARLATANAGPAANRDASRGSPRGLCEITNEKHVFVRIHMWLVWILSAGGRHFVEIFPNCDYLTSDSEKTDDDDDDDYDIEQFEDAAYTDYKVVKTDTRRNNLMSRFANVEMIREICTPEFVGISKKSPTLILRQLASCLSKQEFRQLLYASLTGIQVLVRGPKPERLEALYALSHLVPRACRRVHVTASEYTENEECNNFLGVESTVAVPLPCSSVCRLEIIAEEHRSETEPSSHLVRWAGNLPLKLPTLLIKLEKSLDNDQMSDGVLRAHFAALQEEWANIAKVLHAMRGRGHRGDLSGLMMSLGAGPHDQKLLDAWSMGLPSNPA